MVDSLDIYTGGNNYNLYNDILYGGGVIYDEDLESYPPQLNTGFLKLGIDNNSDQVKKKIINHSKFNKGINISSDAGLFLSTKYYGTLISPRSMVLAMHFPTDYYDNRNNYSLGFWINVDKLNGNGLAFSKVNGAFSFFSNQDLKTIGAKAYQQNNKDNNYIFEVARVDGDYSYIRYNPDNTYIIRFFIYKESGLKVKELEILNPVFLDGINHQIDPYFYYKSQSETLKSNKKGKLAVIIGDSQHQDRELHKVIARRTGLNIISMARGGHSIKYKHQNKNRPNMFWFYEKNLKEAILKIKNVDYYILQLSTNDTNGGGELSVDAIQEVINNYPYYGDDATTINNKIAKFNSLIEVEKENIFGYKQTFAAFIMQFLEINPQARLILASTPISPHKLTGKADADGNGIWQDGWNPLNARTAINPRFESIRNDSKEVSEWFGANWIDLKNGVGLTFDNAINYCLDGTHWKKEIKIRIGKALSEELEKM
ncbi:hypothetical protein SAMN04488027_102107 [Psychroflexus sediminis]|uniref:Uncharacterized protein n=2 Tax=Psychroflexus sediminis TaxID=470826 RepID=A0A1G7UIT5_9FLAO|nr:hypothetical protein SAMN04488027_102107 [Psychroflexus sediminis]